MATAKLARGMGSFFKDCTCTRKTRCQHPYTIRFRDALGKQREESGFATQDDAIGRLIVLYEEKKSTSASVAAARRDLGRQTLEQYAEDWRKRQRKWLDYSTGSRAEHELTKHVYPLLGSRRMESFTPLVVERFVANLEGAGVGLATRVMVLRRLKTVLRDAHEKGAIKDDPMRGVQEPLYTPERAVIPSPEYLAQAIEVADPMLAMMIVMMAGCGLRTGEARAVNINNIVADDVYRITEQVHAKTGSLAQLKHRRPGEFRETPLPKFVRESLEGYGERYGTTDGGYLLQGAHSKLISKAQVAYRVKLLFRELPPPEGMTLYGFRHFFASSCLTNGIPITDVSEWLGHSNIQITFNTYRHLMPGAINKAAAVLDVNLQEHSKPTTASDGHSALAA